jgi:glycosyltransferase involved in cell wall biosynthesis
MISVIIPAHNYGKYILECLNSILNNNNSLINEIIIINDSSIDETDLILKDYPKKNNKIKYYNKSFRSLSKSLNFAITKASANLITKVDADDWVEKNFLEIYYNTLKKNNYDFIYGNLRIVSELNKKILYRNQYVSLFNKKLKYPYGSGTIFKKILWEKVGGFNEKIKYQDDYDFWLRLNKLKKIKIGYINQSLYNYRKHKNNMSKNFYEKNITKTKIFFKNLF